MRVLITNSHEIQAYTILRSLRPEAERIVVTTGRASVSNDGYGGMAPFSRYVDACHEVPAFSADWLAGRWQPGNTEAEEVYVQRIEAICRDEKLDVIFPSLDPEVYLFAKNKQRLAGQGILTVVPDFDVVRVPMDKAATVHAARRAGFPCPRTYFPNDESELDDIATDTAGPWIVKPRFTAHAQNMVYVDRADGLQAAFAKVAAHQSNPIVQEYIQGGRRRNYYITVGRDSEILSLLTPKVVRTQRNGFRVASKSCLSASTGPYVDELRNLVRELNLWGGYTIQTQIDPRDSTPKLMEINARVGHHLWWRTALGVNEPRILVQLANNETPQGNFTFPDDVLLLDPLHDLIFIYEQVVEAVFDAISWLLRRPPGKQPDNPGLSTTIRHCFREYINPTRKAYCPEVASLFSDPYPCLRAFCVRFGRRTRSLVNRALRFGRSSLQSRQAHS